MGLFGGIIGAVGGALEGSANRQHDKDMAALNQQFNMQNMAKEQEYNLETMAKQNEYQIAQWNRENEYNDPSAVAARYRAAGINPRAAFGQGSASGAGIAGGLSSAPSGGAPSGSGQMGSAHPTTAVSHALSSMDVASGLSSLSTVMRTQAETEGIEIDNRTRETKNLLELEQKRIDLIKSDVDIQEKRKSIQFIDQQIEESRKRIQSLDQQIKESGQRIRQSKADIQYTEQKTKDARLRNEFYEKYGFFPNQSWYTSLLTYSNRQVEKVAQTFTQGKSEINTPSLGGIVPNFLDSAAGQKFVSFIKEAPDNIKQSFQQWVNRGAKLTPTSVKRWYNAISKTKEFQSALEKNRIPLKDIIWSLAK